ncbi:MAG: YbaB/EbfC family nucleoid-associated protein [Oscillospiraceae bacterium]|nr:YbaB/EbfC family nucleoid-associated protein [Candidatus Limimonas coprohippi]MCQ2488352.1 YbaB/EbfC family nucleoid-associated protein [Clostridia bacterium]
MKARIPNQGGGMNQAAMMKQLQNMQTNMEATQKEIEETEFTASSGGGAVEVAVTGAGEVKTIKIQPDVVDPEDVEMLEDMLIAALNEATRKGKETMEREMGKITGGMNIPGLNGLL